MLEGPISTGFSNKLNNFDSNNGIPTSKNTILYIYIYIELSYITLSRIMLHIYIYIYIYICSYITDSTPLRKDTGVFESYGRLIIILLD